MHCEYEKRAQAIYQKLEGEDVYHLSTCMYPKHRKRVLKAIKDCLQEKKRCILIATSLVEAGVDLDFQSVYRELAGVDSMIQAAGRCNREGKRNADESRVFIFRFDGKENVPGQRQQIDVAKALLADNQDISALDSIRKYFEILYHFRGEGLDKKKIMDEFKNKIYNFAKVGKEFKLIEENTKIVFINREDEADNLLQQIKYQGYTKSGIRKAGQYCITLYDREIKKLNGAGMLQPVSEDMIDFYELVNNSQYTEEMGLNLDIDFGMAVIM